MALSSDQKAAEAAAKKRQRQVAEAVAAALLFLGDKLTISFYWLPDAWDEFAGRLGAALDPVSSASDAAARAVFGGYDALAPEAIAAQAMARDMLVTDLVESSKKAVSAVVQWANASGVSSGTAEAILSYLAGMNANQLSPVLTDLSAAVSIGRLDEQLIRIAKTAAKGKIAERAGLIAGDALWSGVQLGRMLAGKQEQQMTNAQVTKTWVTVGDERVCSICGPLDGVKVGIDEFFPGGFKMPGAHPNCRCHTEISVKDPDE